MVFLIIQLGKELEGAFGFEIVHSGYLHLTPGVHEIRSVFSPDYVEPQSIAIESFHPFVSGFYRFSDTFMRVLPEMLERSHQHWIDYLPQVGRGRVTGDFAYPEWFVWDRRILSKCCIIQIECQPVPEDGLGVGDTVGGSRNMDSRVGSAASVVGPVNRHYLAGLLNQTRPLNRLS